MVAGTPSESPATGVCARLACLVFQLMSGSSHVDASHVVTTQMIWFYLACGVWKLNPDFLNPQISCSGGFLVLLLCGWLPKAWLTDTLVSATIRLAPHVTAFVELSIPLCLYLGKYHEVWPGARQFTVLGITAIALHFLGCLPI